MANELTTYSLEFIQKITELKVSISRKYAEISATETPAVDGQGIKIIQKRPDGKDYIIEAYMRAKLTELFPGWSWEMAAPLAFLGSEWVVAQGHLTIIDESLLILGIIPPIRKYYGVDSVRIQFKKDADHKPENIIDIGDNCQQANTGAFKRALNRLTGIGDDIYKKRIDLDGAGSIETIIMTGENPDLSKKLVMDYINTKHILPSKVFEMLGIANFNEITNWLEAYEKIKNH
jgi:hypothetical protein